MFYALIMLVTVGGQVSEYVVDEFATRADCHAAAVRAVPGHYRDVASVRFACERTRVEVRVRKR